MKTLGDKIDENVIFFWKKFWAKVCPFFKPCPLQTKVIKKHKINLKIFLFVKKVPVLFLQFLNTISLRGTTTQETISMDLYGSEQLSE